MDGFETIRRAATELHDIVAGDGTDIFDPIALVKAAVDHLDLELVWLHPGDPCTEKRPCAVR